MTENEISKFVVDAAIKIHREVGPGLLETVYETILYNELCRQGLKVERQKGIRIRYQGQHFHEGFRADLLIENKVILELKSVERISTVHQKQLLTYLRLSGVKLGLLLNFGEELMRQGIQRIVNGLEEE